MYGLCQGPRHSRSQLAGDVQDVKVAQKAKDYLRDSLQMKRRIHGNTDHPDTRIARNARANRRQSHAETVTWGHFWFAHKKLLSFA